MGEWFQDYGALVGVVLAGVFALVGNAVGRRQGASAEQNHWLRQEQLAAASELTAICQRMALSIDAPLPDDSLEALLNQLKTPIAHEGRSPNTVMWEEGWIAVERLSLVAGEEFGDAGRALFTKATAVSAMKMSGRVDEKELEAAQLDFGDQMKAFRELAHAEFRPKRRT